MGGADVGGADAARLAAALAAFPGQPFAVVDGGLFDDLPGVFKRERLFARSLFLDTADLDVQAADPWLVALDQAPEAAARVMALPAPKPAMTVWCCAGETVLYRHLRTLTTAPRGSPASSARPARSPSTVECHVAVGEGRRRTDDSRLPPGRSIRRSGAQMDDASLDGRVPGAVDSWRSTAVSLDQKNE